MFSGDYLFILAVFSVVYTFGSQINHIDDTDETYGYWEPLHYLLYGTGLQTWEYSPQYAIRTYAFIIPFYLVGSFLIRLGVPKLSVFFGLRCTLGALTAFCNASLLQSFRQSVDRYHFYIAFVFMLLSAGQVFVSTSFLPSAVSMNLFSFAMSCWLRDKYEIAILSGCIAVLCTGWPFIGLVFAPMGLYMLWSRWTFVDTEIHSRTYRDHPFFRVLRLISVGIFMMVFVQGAVLLVDGQMYNKWYVVY
jgi:alpha-1,2-mannosyltransferase